MKNDTRGLRGVAVLTVVLTCLAIQAVFTLPAYGDEIVAWGDIISAPVGNDFTAISAGGYHYLALRSDGSIVAWGSNGQGQAIAPTGNDFTAIAAGGFHSLALKSDGSIIGWGMNNYGQSIAPTGNDFIAIAAGMYHSLALKADGSIVGWGYNGYFQTNSPEGNDFIAISAGWFHSLALKNDGTIVGFGLGGSPNYGEENPPTEDGFTAIAAGMELSLALKSDGNIVAWGRNDYGQATPPSGTDFIAIDAGVYHGIALKSDGSIVAWGSNGQGQSIAQTGNDFTAIAAGWYHSLALVSTNSPPVADAGGPYLVALGQEIMLDGSGSHDLDEDMLSYFWDQVEDLGNFDDEIAVNPSFTGTLAGVTKLELWVSDGPDIDDTDLDSTMLVVYDPSAGFVTGGGWIDSPSGAYTPENQDDDDLTGKANFGFVSKYKKGAEVPTGNTEFQFNAGDLNFHSSSYDWLVVTGSNYARFKGTGTVNGDGPYKFMLWAGDDNSDTFRIKIWWEDGEIENVVYDNGFNQEIGGGSIVIHAK